MSSSLVIILMSLLICLLVYLIVVLSKNDMVKLTDKSIPLESIIPIHSIENGYIINKNGDITVGYKVFLPEVFTLVDGQAEHIHLGLENILRTLPSGTVFHQQTFIYTSKYELTEHSENYFHMSNLKSLKGTEMLNMYAHIYITFTNNRANRNPLSTSLLRRSAKPFSKPLNIEQRLGEIKNHLLSVDSGFSSIDSFSIKRMTDIELNNALFDYTNLSYDIPTKDATKEVVQPISIDESGIFKSGNKLINVISLIEEGAQLNGLKMPKISKTEAINTKIEIPNATNPAGMMFPLTLGLPFDHIVNTVIEVTNQEDVIKTLESESSSLNLLSNFYRAAKEKQTNIKSFTNEIAEHSYPTSYTAVNIIIHDHDKDNLAAKAALVKQSFSNMNQSTAYIENEEAANLFFCSLPGNARSNYRGFTNIIKQALCYLIKEGLYLSSFTGHIYHDRFGNPARLNMWFNVLIDNRNKILIGPSGSGKSFWLNNYASQSWNQGKDTMIIDIGGSFKNLIQINKGKYFDSRKKSQFAFNPFLCPKDGSGNYMYNDVDEDGEGSEDIVNTIATIILLIWKKDTDSTPVEEELVKNSVIAFYKHVNQTKIFPTMKEYKSFLPAFHESLKPVHKDAFRIDDIDLLLTPYTDGEHAHLLNATNDIDIVDDTLIGYDMEYASKKSYFPIIAVLTLSVIIEKIKRRRGVPKTLIIDEALDFLVDKKFGNFIGYLYRTFRKKEGEVIIAAQNVDFIVNASDLVRQSIEANADTKIILEHGEKNLKQVEALSVIGITEEERKRVLSLRRSDNWREFFIKMGNKGMILRNGVSEQCAVAFDSKEATVVAIENLYKETGSIPAAIEEYLNQQRKKYA